MMVMVVMMCICMSDSMSTLFLSHQMMMCVSDCVSDSMSVVMMCVSDGDGGGGDDVCE